MIRRFRFEAESYESLNCLPMAARTKFDAVGIELHQTQWEMLGRGERLIVCVVVQGPNQTLSGTW